MWLGHKGHVTKTLTPFDEVVLPCPLLLVGCVHSLKVTRWLPAALRAMSVLVHVQRKIDPQLPSPRNCQKKV